MNFKLEELFLGLVDVEGVSPFPSRMAALKSVVEHVRSGAPVSDEIRQWFCDGFDSLEAKHTPDMSLGVEQRLLAKSFGFSPKQGGYGRERQGREIAKGVCIIELGEGCNAGEAIDRYTARKWPSRPEMHESIRQAYYRYREAVVADAENYLEL